jgi:hypothetical protein
MRISEDFPAKTTSFAIGILSLGTETLWVRAFSFLGQSKLTAVATILGIYLLGIAFGAELGARLCRTQDSKKLIDSLRRSLLAGSAVILVSPLILVAVEKGTAGHGFRSIIWQALAAGYLAFQPAFIFSICFSNLPPSRNKVRIWQDWERNVESLCSQHLWKRRRPLLVNFVILQFATTELAFAILGFLGVGAATLLLSYAEPRRGHRMASAACFVFGVANLIALVHSDNWLIRSPAGTPPNLDIWRVVETRQGIVVSYKDEALGDVIYGGNV